MRKVILSKRAGKQLEKLLGYLEKEWSLNVKREFIKKLDKSIYQIQKYPDSSPQSEIIKGLHKHVVTNQTTLYYKFDNESVSVLSIFDNRMDPKKIEK